MIKTGVFPFQKGLEHFELEFQPSINPEQIQDFTTLRFLEKQDNIVFLGSSGGGKTYLPINKEDSNLFFQLTGMRYEKKSTIINTNINFGDWESIFYDPKWELLLDNLYSSLILSTVV